MTRREQILLEAMKMLRDDHDAEDLQSVRIFAGLTLEEADKAFEPGGVDLIVAERARQITEEHHTAEEDDRYTNGQMALAAVAYIAPEPVYSVIKNPRSLLLRDPWPWNPSFDARGRCDRIRLLTMGGALAAAEIDRLLRVKL